MDPLLELGNLVRNGSGCGLEVEGYCTYDLDVEFGLAYLVSKCGYGEMVS
ncbi:MAG: hypothetical protein RMX26_10030 [Planktomarina sp.]|nr:hypothetical protein [Planktomarina sp.]